MTYTGSSRTVLFQPTIFAQENEAFGNFISAFRNPRFHIYSIPCPKFSFGSTFMSLQHSAIAVNVQGDGVYFVDGR
jgi:hypothetical protein